MKFWKTIPKFFIEINPHDEDEQELYSKQISHLGSALLVDDYKPNIKVNEAVYTEGVTELNFPPGALISGSFAVHSIMEHLCKWQSQKIKYDDIDIYFKSETDAKSFIKANSNSRYLSKFNFDNPMCAYGFYCSEKLNLIYGVPYESPADLISRFDIRACSMAIDPNAHIVYTVEGAIRDATNHKIIFNSVPRGVSIRRLTKYIQKGFEISGHQSLFFSELIRSPIYSAELELMTKKY